MYANFGHVRALAVKYPPQMNWVEPVRPVALALEKALQCLERAHGNRQYARMCLDEHE